MIKRLLFAMLLLPVSAQAAEPLVLKPSSDWVLDFGDERCSLMRDFGTGDDKLRLQVDNYGTKFGYRAMVSGQLVQAPTVVPLTDIVVGYSPDTQERDRFFALAGTANGVKSVAWRQAFLPVAPGSSKEETERLNREFGDSVTSMTIQFALRRPIRLDTGSMAGPFAAMRKCVDDLIASWGLDPAQHWALSRAPQLLPKPGARPTSTFRVTESGVQQQLDEPRFLKPSDRRARQIAAQAYHNANMIPLRVMVDAAGQSTACVVQAPASEAFKQKVCERFAGPYQPALDAAGKPVASVAQFESL